MHDPGYRSTDPAWFPSPKIIEREELDNSTVPAGATGVPKRRIKRSVRMVIKKDTKTFIKLNAAIYIELALKKMNWRRLQKSLQVKAQSIPMATNELLIQQDLLATEPTFVVPAPCPYDKTQGIATQLALTYDEVKRAKARGRRIDTLVYSFYFGA
ncbi:hypothetical protein C2G38_2155760 [Gigaspora rosea]|uniref:Uncharacterized protein n=1 Tax=Gigaspora rosea TaxID=44941 RepID=A0A397W5D4_9GLOM|nr:hypothetical protein C2G38_2155760 [Gigaspora rosea]